MGAEHTEVKSAHHQGLEELGEGVVATGWADDGVVEAIELPDRSFAVGVPEEDERSRWSARSWRPRAARDGRSRLARPAPREAHG